MESRNLYSINCILRLSEPFTEPNVIITTCGNSVERFGSWSTSFGSVGDMPLFLREPLQLLAMLDGPGFVAGLGTRKYPWLHEILVPEHRLKELIRGEHTRTES